MPNFKEVRRCLFGPGDVEYRDAYGTFCRGSLDLMLIRRVWEGRERASTVPTYASRAIDAAADGPGEPGRSDWKRIVLSSGDARDKMLEIALNTLFPEER